MTMTVEAVYESGIFRPLEQMDLMEGRHVKLKVDAEDVAPALPPGPDLNPVAEIMSEAQAQARLEIVLAIAALAVPHGRLENASRDHDKFLYGPEGAR